MRIRENPRVRAHSHHRRARDRQNYCFGVLFMCQAWRQFSFPHLRIQSIQIQVRVFKVGAKEHKSRVWL